MDKPYNFVNTYILFLVPKVSDNSLSECFFPLPAFFPTCGAWNLIGAKRVIYNVLKC